MTKRSWTYLLPPKAFEVAPCACGNHDTMWSEFEKHVWCPKCQHDFLPAHNGVFDGPIPMQLAQMLGLRFDRIQLLTKQIERWDFETSTYKVDEAATAMWLAGR